jgi:Kef-type K+ transport system membrane component KefB
MEWLDAFRSHAVALPNLAKFAIVMAIIACAPALARRVRIPELVGLVAFGILLGPYVLDVAPKNHPIVQFFGDLGRLLLMFGAGLEININLFRKAQTRSVIFGLITTAGLFRPSSSARCWHRTLCSLCRSSRALAPSHWNRSSSRLVPLSYRTLYR